MSEVIDGYTFVITSYGSPEQYDVYKPLGGKIGYVRLRYGVLTAHIYTYSQSPVFEVYRHDFNDERKDMFESGEERRHHLTLIAQAIRRRCARDNCYSVREQHAVFEGDDVKPVLVRYYTWTEKVTAGDLQKKYDELYQIRPEFKKDSIDGRIRWLMPYFVDKIITWEIIDYEEVC